MDNSSNIICENCKKSIDSSKYDMHIIGCKKYSFMCSCGENVIKSNEQSHHEEFHRIIECDYCNYVEPFYKFKDHMKECKYKPILCRYCEIEVPGKHFDIHQDYCGSKTYQCDKCKQSLLKREKEFHDKISCAAQKAMLLSYPGGSGFFEHDEYDE